VDVGNTLLYSFFAVLQVYIFKAQGAKAYYKKIIGTAGTAAIAGITYNLFIPAYSVVEVSRMASMENVKLYWILAIITVVTLIIRLILSKVSNYVLDVDQKVGDAYALINTLPALGSLTLVLGTALCYPDCPLDGDPQCDNILGLMMITYLIYNLVLFIIGFIIMSSTRNKYSFIKEKLKFTWYRLLTKKNYEDLYAKLIIYKYIKDEDKAEEIYQDFIANHILEADENYNYVYVNKKPELALHAFGNMNPFNTQSYRFPSMRLPSGKNVMNFDDKHPSVGKKGDQSPDQGGLKRRGTMAHPNYGKMPSRGTVGPHGGGLRKMGTLAPNAFRMQSIAHGQHHNLRMPSMIHGNNFRLPSHMYATNNLRLPSNQKFSDNQLNKGTHNLQQDYDNHDEIIRKVREDRQLKLLLQNNDDSEVQSKSSREGNNHGRNESEKEFLKDNSHSEDQKSMSQSSEGHPLDNILETKKPKNVKFNAPDGDSNKEEKSDRVFKFSQSRKESHLSADNYHNQDTSKRALESDKRENLDSKISTEDMPVNHNEVSKTERTKKLHIEEEPLKENSNRKNSRKVSDSSKRSNNTMVIDTLMFPTEGNILHGKELETQEKLKDPKEENYEIRSEGRDNSQAESNKGLDKSLVLGFFKDKVSDLYNRFFQSNKEKTKLFLEKPSPEEEEGHNEEIAKEEKEDHEDKPKVKKNPHKRKVRRSATSLTLPTNKKEQYLEDEDQKNNLRKKHLEDEALEMRLNQDPNHFGIVDQDKKIFDIDHDVAEIKINEKRFDIIKDNIELNEQLVDDIIFGTTYKKLKKIKIKERSRSFDDHKTQKRMDFYEKVNAVEQVQDVFYKDKLNINNYFEDLFQVVEDEVEKEVMDNQPEDQELDKSQVDTFNHIANEKTLALAKISDETIPVFGTVDSLQIGRNDLVLLDEAWKEFEEKMKEKKVKVTFNVKVVDIDIKLIMKKIFNPPVLGCIIGLFFGISGMRDLLFSKNHYLKNIYKIITMGTKAFVPLLFVNVGNSLFAVPKFNVGMALTKFQIYFSFIITFVIVPFLGMGMIKFWEAVYGGIIEESKVFRFAMFVTCALPVSPNFIIILSILDGFYLEEYSYVLNKQTISMILTETIILLIYFVIIN